MYGSSAARRFLLLLTNEPILAPAGLHAVESEFVPLDRYRGIVADAVFDHLGRPSFFAALTEVMMERIRENIQTQEKT
jgi:hypothetical protein